MKQANDDGPLLTARQFECIKLIAEHWNKHDYSPTQSWLQSRMGNITKPSVQQHIALLVKKGMLKVDFGKWRNLKLANQALQLLRKQSGHRCVVCGCHRGKRER